MNTFTCKPSTEGSSKVTWRLITPNSSINLTRLKQGVGERFTERASSALVMRALSCKALRMAISVRSSFFIRTIILNLEYLENIYPHNWHFNAYIRHLFRNSPDKIAAFLISGESHLEC